MSDGLFGWVFGILFVASLAYPSTFIAFLVLGVVFFTWDAIYHRKLPPHKQAMRELKEVFKQAHRDMNREARRYR